MRRIVLLAPLLTVALSAQTRITPPPNSYDVQEDVKLGREAAQQAEAELPIMHDDEVTSYIERVGQRLVEAIPAELRHPEFHYTFKAVNVREINAFALPGGPMFVNRGMIEAATTEGEVAGVMAHELSHVVLRHGTAQASKAQKYAIGQIAGQVLGAIIGGAAGSVISQGSQFGLGTAFLRFSREYEKEADIEGAQIMARAGYDPRDMARMFQTIEKSGGSGGPQWLSDHPNPGNRVEYITQEAQMLHVDNPVRDSRAFDDVKAHLRSLAPAPTTEQATRNARNRRTSGGGPTGGPTTNNVPRGEVEAPSSKYRDVSEGGLFKVSVPSNWRELQSENSVTFAPDGGYGTYNDSNIFTHGVEIGTTRNESHDLQGATDELIGSLHQGNPRMRQDTGYRQTSIDGREALATQLSNVSEATGRAETVQIVTTELASGDLLYLISVAPASEFSTYRNTFQRVADSVRLTDSYR